MSVLGGGPLGDLPADLNSLNSAPFSQLIANPALLNKVNTAAAFLGTTYQQVAKTIVDTMKQSDDCAFDLANSVNSFIGYETSAQQSALSDIVSGISGDFVATCNTLLSGIHNDLDTCSQEISEAVANMNTEDVLQVENPTIPKPSNWTGNISWEQWIQTIPKYFYVNSNGMIIHGVRLMADGSVMDFNNTILHAQDYASWNDFYGGQGFYGNGTSFPSGPLVYAVTPKCNPKPLNQQLQQVYLDTFNPSTGNTGNPVTGVVSGVPTTSTTGIGQGGANVSPGNCPCPVVNVNVQPTPITINVPPCPTPSVTTNVQGMSSSSPSGEQVNIGTKGIPLIPSEDWEPPVTDLIEQFLDTVGFPKDFVEFYGNISKDLELRMEAAKSAAISEDAMEFLS